MCIIPKTVVSLRVPYVTHIFERKGLLYSIYDLLCPHDWRHQKGRADAKPMVHGLVLGKMTAPG